MAGLQDRPFATARAADIRAVDPRAGSQDAEAVSRGLLLWACVGTIGAVEYLKANGIDGAVIGRVLSGGPVRAGDRLPAMGWLSANAAPAVAGDAFIAPRPESSL